MGAKTSAVALWKSEAETAPLADLRKALRSALKKDNSSAIAALATFLPRRLAQPAAKPVRTETGDIRTPPNEDAVRADLERLIGQARERLAVAPDPEVLESLSGYGETTSETYRLGRAYRPERRWKFQREDDVRVDSAAD